MAKKNKRKTECKPDFKTDLHKNNTWLFIIISLLTGMLIIPVTSTSALDTAAGLSFGYDSNVSLSSTAEDSAFALYQLKLTQQLFPTSPLIDWQVFIDGTFHDYFQLADNYQIKAGSVFILPIADNRILPGITAEALIYQDDLLEEDERNEFTVGGQIEWLASGRLTLGIRQNWLRADYQNSAVSDYGGHQHGMSDGMPDNMPGHQNHHETETASRDDDIYTTIFQGTLFFSPTIQTDVSFEYEKSESSIENESYAQKGISLSSLWMPHPSWGLDAFVSWRYFDYEDIPDETDRTDTRWHMGMGISYFIKAFEFFIRAERIENDSSLDDESYLRTVTQCGILWQF